MRPRSGTLNPESLDDAQRLAAQLDRRLDDAQRAAIVERLDLSPEALAAFSDAAAVTLELEQGDQAIAIGSARSAAPGRRISRPLLAIAAMIAAVALIPLARSALQRSAADDPAAFGAALAVDAARLPGTWEYAPWSVTRGAGEAMSPTARGVRIGARLTDLEVALRSGDPLAHRFAGEIATLLEGVPLAAPLAARYRAVAGASGDAPDPAGFRETAALVAERAGDDAVRLGAWLEAARLAATHRDAEFFRARESRAALDRLREGPLLDEPARNTLNLLERTAAGSAPDWPPLERDLASLLGRFGS